jgi:hypothetical protein|tara:strand:- start:1266 stop:1565 length:300 start_codon:yes stop_codon:yes gene_type:complete
MTAIEENTSPKFFYPDMYFKESGPTDPTELRVSKDKDIWIGDLVFENGKIWPAWQIASTKKELTKYARQTFTGPIIRVADNLRTQYTIDEYIGFSHHTL